MQAVSEALQVLGYLELPEEDVPDELIWHHQGRLRDHWDAVKERRRNPGSSSERMETVSLTDNEIAKEIDK